jgi:hypothetical protein
VSYIRFVWYRVQTAKGEIQVHRWAENVSQVPEGRRTLDEYHQEEGFTKVAGPFKTRKEALK